MIVDALPLRLGLRVLEIGCGPGAMARAIAARIGDGHVLAIDRSAKAIAQAAASSQADIASGRLSLRCIAVEEFELGLGEAPYDITVAVRVGALDGRHPEAGERARRRIAAALRPQGCLLIDGGTASRSTSVGRRSFKKTNAGF
jgi:cyclopropane fatty-acyl-phospholipid synthase-like methyltransferase